MYIFRVMGPSRAHFQDAAECRAYKSSQGPSALPRSQRETWWWREILGLPTHSTIVCPRCSVRCRCRCRCRCPCHLARSPLCGWLLFGNIQSRTHLKTTLSPRQLSICGPQAGPRIKALHPSPRIPPGSKHWWEWA